MSLDELPDRVARIVEECRRATLATRNEDGTSAVVPVCFGVAGGRVITEVDDKPKGTKELARVRNVRRDPRVTLLFDRWDEDWTRLGWVMVKGIASIHPPGDVAALVQRYPQYEQHPPRGPRLIVDPRHVRWWTWE